MFFRIYSMSSSANFCALAVNAVMAKRQMNSNFLIVVFLIKDFDILNPTFLIPD